MLVIATIFQIWLLSSIYLTPHRKHIPFHLIPVGNGLLSLQAFPDLSRRCIFRWYPAGNVSCNLITGDLQQEMSDKMYLPVAYYRSFLMESNTGNILQEMSHVM